MSLSQRVPALGGQQRTLSLVGGPTGQAIDHEFARAGIYCRWIWAEKATRVCTTLLERGSRLVTELVERAPCRRAGTGSLHGGLSPGGGSIFSLAVVADDSSSVTS